MGQVVTKDVCVNLSDLSLEEYTELIKTPFTVLRSDGRAQDGWQIPAVREPDRDLYDRKMGNEFVASHAFRDNDEKWNGNPNRPWNVFLVRDQPTAEKDNKVWGWRRLRPDLPAAFWPTKLKTDEEREAWKLEFCQKLQSLNVFYKKTEEQQKASDALQEEMDKAAESAGTYSVFTVEEEGTVKQIKKLLHFSEPAVEAVIALLQKERVNA
jgi:hypothetical protein